jgi:hypothetical protein
MHVIALLLLLLMIGCGAGESAVSSSDAEALVRQTVAEVKEKERVSIVVRLEKAEPPSTEELALRTKIVETIEAERVGAVVGSGADVGSFDVTVEVDSTADGVPKIREILRGVGVLERSVVRVVGKTN